MCKPRLKIAAWAVAAALAAYMLWPAWVAAVGELLSDTAGEEAAAEEPAGEAAPSEGEAPATVETAEGRVAPFRTRDAWLDVGTFGLADGVLEDFPLHFQSWVLLTDLDPGPWLGDWREIASAARHYYASGFEEPFDRSLMDDSYKLIKEEEEFYAWEQERGLIPDIEFGRESDIKFEGRKLFTAGYSKTTYPGGNPYLGGGQPAGDFTMEGELQLRIEGTVMRKTHVYVDYDDTRENETRNQVSVVYKGDPDEFVQEAAFGDIILSLPSTEFVSYSSSRAVFGAKVDLKYKWARLMAVASREKGETEKATFRGGTELTSLNVADTGYSKRRFFLLNTYYDQGNDRTYFEEKGGTDRKIFTSANGQPKVEVFVYTPGAFPLGTTKVKLEAWEFDDAAGDGETTKNEKYIEKNVYCKKLARGTEYTVDVDKGIITFNTSVAETQIIAVAYIVADGDNTPVNWIGYDESDNTLDYTSKENGTIWEFNRSLKCIKTDKVAELQRYELRNYYYMGSTNIKATSLVVKVLNNNNSENDPEVEGKTFLYTLGLDRDKDGRVDGDFRDTTYGYLIVPDVTYDAQSDTFTRNDREPADGYLDYLPFDYDGDGTIKYYDAYKPETVSKRKFYFEFESLKPSYFLHPNIIPGSESVKLNGRLLVANKDYWLDYDSGFLELLTEGADDPTAVLEITYEYKPLFALLAKSLVGGRFQFGPDDNRYLGTTLIAEFTSKPPGDDIPKLEEAPIDHFVFDTDGRYRFFPEFMTTLADAVPGAHTTEGSTFDLRGEYARSHRKINTVGEALIDDMEGARLLSTVSMDAKRWKYSSPPADGALGQADRGNKLLELFSEQTLLNEVDPDWPRDTLEVLAVKNLPDDPGGGAGALTNTWGGIHRVLSPTGIDFAESRFEYVELIINLNNLNDKSEDDIAGGVLHLDLGTISEDADSDGVLDTEDTDPPDGILSPEEDEKGITFNNEGAGGSIHVDIKTENVLDTEDNNLNFVLDADDDYYAYEIDLEEVVNKTSPYLIRHPDSPDQLKPGWYILRLPLDFDAAQTVGSPEATSLQVLRLWLEATDRDDFPSGSVITFATVTFAAMRWEEPELDPDKGLNQMKISTKDSRHDGDYIPLRTVKDPETKTIEREQALVMEYLLTDWEDVGVESSEGFTVWGAGNNVYDTEDANHNGVLDAGEDVGVGPYHFGAGNGRLDEEPAPEGSTRYANFEGQDYSRYRTMQFYYFNRSPQDGGGFDSDNDLIFLRFGADEDNYYEYAVQMNGDQAWQTVTVDLERFLTLHGKGQPFVERDEEIIYEHYRIVGDPSLLNVVEVRVGVRTKLPEEGGSNGYLALREVWVNDLELLDPEDQLGQAMRGRASFDFGNFIKVGGGFRDVSAGFEEIGRTSTARSTTTSRDADATVELAKFMPDLWNVRMPVTGYVSKSETLTEEKYDPKQSIYNQGRTIAVSRRAGISFSKYKLPSWDFDFRNSDSVNYKYARISESDTYSGGVDYDLYPRRRYLPVNVRSDFDRQFQKTTYGEKDKENQNTDWVTDDSRSSIKFEPIEDLEITPSYDYSYTWDHTDDTEESFDESYGLRVNYFYVKGLRPGTSYTSSYREIVQRIGGSGGGGTPGMDRGPHLGTGEALDLSLATSNSFSIPVDVGKLTNERARGLNKWSITPSYELIRSSSYTEIPTRASIWYRLGRDFILPEFTDTKYFVNSRRRHSVTVNNRLRPLEFLGYREGTTWENWDFIQMDFDFSYSNELSNTTGTATRTISTTFPDVEFQLYGTKNFPLAANYLDRSTVVISYNKKRTYQRWHDVEIRQRPGISWRATWTRNFRTRADYNYTHTNTQELDAADEPTGPDRTVKEDNPSLTLYYDIANPRGFKIPLLGTLRWRNELNLTAGVSLTKIRSVEASQEDTDRWEYTLSGGYYVTTNLRADVTGQVTRFTNYTTAAQDYMTVGITGNFVIIF